MANYHCHVQVIGRSKGRSAVGASAYRSGTKMTNEHDGLTHDYTNKTGIVYKEVMLPENAKVEWQDREALWNAVEKIEKGSRAQLAREFDFALPKELNLEEQIRLTRNFVGINFVTDGMCADIAIHDKGDGNPHAHVMLTMRPIDQEGEWEHKSEKVYLCKNLEGEEKGFTARELKELPDPESWQKQLPYYKNGNSKLKPVYLTEYERANNPEYRLYERVKGKNDPKKDRVDRLNPTMEKWNSKDYLMNYREDLAYQINQTLEENGISERVDHRSFQEQGKDKLPTKHLGVSASQMEKRGIETERGNINREIQNSNKKLHEIDSQIRILEQQHNFIKLDIQIQTVHDYLQRMKGEIRHSEEKQFGNIEKSINQLEEYIETFRNSEAGNGKFVEIGESKYPFREYHLKKFDDALMEAKELFQEHKISVEKPIDKTTAKPSITEIAKKLYRAEREYIEIQVRIAEGDRSLNRPRLTSEYISKIEHINFGIEKLKEYDLQIKTNMEEKEGLGIFKGKEKARLQEVIDRAIQDREAQVTRLKSLGVHKPEDAATVVNELKKMNEAEKNAYNEFSKGRKDLQYRMAELKADILERKLELSPEDRKLVKEHLTNYRQNDKNEKVKGNKELKMTIDEYKAEINAIKDLEPADTTQQFKPKERDFNLDR